MEHHCIIVARQKRRNGKPKWWCTVHHSKAWDPQGNKLSQCSKSIQLIPTDQVVLLDPFEDIEFAAWGAVGPIYNTTSDKAIEEGIHIHVRNKGGGPKLVDKTFTIVKVKVPSLFSGAFIQIGKQAAQAYMVCKLVGSPMIYLECPHSGCEREPHLDAGEFAVRFHNKHQCGKCGREFRTSKVGFSNPLVRLKELYESGIERKIVSANRSISIKQIDYPDGIKFWPSNPALLWTQSHQEEEGTHLHCYNANGERIVDDTFSVVEIDGYIINNEQVKYYAAQRELPHIVPFLTSVACPHCHKLHFDKGESAVKPHREHFCEYCKLRFSSRKGWISNPLIQTLEELSRAIR